MKVRFIFNPHSGSNRRNPHLRDKAAEFIAHCGWDGKVVSTERPRHATELARAAVDEGCELVVAIGGDGTMNEVASALVNTPAAFGLIPCGSGNGLGRHLGIPRAGRGAFRALAEGAVTTIDAGKVNQHLFFCAAGTGFEALIAERFALLTSRGFAGYLKESAKAWWSYRPERYTIHHPGGRDAVEAFTLAIANSSQYGNNAYIAPDASVSDGMLDVVAVPHVNAFRAVPLAIRLFHGSINRVPDVRHFQGSQFVIERAKPGWMHTDGEPRAETSRIEVSVLPRSLRVMVPRTAALETKA
ncbi:MAG: diacylglycerol kinase family lipid kinase [Candidatus Didemnitutus sp.]|nr:diacylglycerol kinase family lipid kinase [Candidatus Didemnitutus sp.]